MQYSIPSRLLICIYCGLLITQTLVSIYNLQCLVHTALRDKRWVSESIWSNTLLEATFWWRGKKANDVPINRLFVLFFSAGGTGLMVDGVYYFSLQITATCNAVTTLPYLTCRDVTIVHLSEGPQISMISFNERYIMALLTVYQSQIDALIAGKLLEAPFFGA